MDKSLHRANLLAKRDKLSKKAVQSKSQKIFQNFLKLPGVFDKDNFLLYLPVRGEVDTSQIIEFLQSKNKRILLPVFDKKSGEYKISVYEVYADLESGPYAILQPVNIRTADIDQVEIALIPGVAFDTRGDRLGYGKGVYDRLLGGFKGLKIGLAYDFQIVDKLPVEEHDMKMDLVVTEKGIYRIK